MKWTPALIAELRAAARLAYGSESLARVAARLGVSESAAYQKARHMGILKVRPAPRAEPSTPATELRNRWATLIGPMKAALRAEIERDA